ncbi:hybrid sensor histidine kinase/response regulator [Argonema antarcticum]|uniref:hybrid sensor histidine kinase/response regulator n=1 Tax=Argonema antarcticum TaxID=2942763 RepID=UPI002013BDCF|nr:ATP-binding protein [Argonema antarcticum]MCL1470540.1 response regulator [Argonema antarcticum A004/B2]
MTNKKILIVEDEIIVAEDVAVRLRKLGYIVTDIVTTGEEAIERAEQSQPDLILMDIVLEGDIDGIIAAEEIRNRFNIPIVFLTAYADEKTLQRAKLTDPFAYIIKPFHQKDLQANIEIAIHRHELENKMQQALENSEQLLQIAQEQAGRQNRYVAMAAHELRNPLTAILTSTKLLEFSRSRWDDESKLKCLRLIQSATQNMNQLIEDMLMIGRAEAEQLQFNPAPLNLSEFCQFLVEKMQLNTESKHQLSFVSSGVIVATLDQRLLQHILSNLLSNAIKYSPNGGTITLELEIEKSKKEFTSQESSAVIFRIQDRGIGIPEEDLGKLFEPFHRCNNVGGIAGNGLGLTIVKKAVDLHGGAIAVESEVGVGTTFIVTLPC